MATINTITFDQAVYNPGATITCAVNWTPDTAPVAPQEFTLTAVVTNASGEQTATSTSTFTVNEPQASADVVSVSDTGSRTWTSGAVTMETGGTFDSVFTATA